MASRNQDLYRWKRWSQKETPSSHVNSKKKTQVPATDDIQNWIKKVEKASDRAAAMTFGHSNSRYGDIPIANAHGTAAATLEALHDHDEAHSEAQELLSQWMAQKCSATDSDDDIDLKYFQEEGDMRYYSASKEAAKSDLKSHWNNMLAENDPIAMDPYSKISSEELFQEIESRDDNEAVQGILEVLMKKDIVETRLKKDWSVGTETKKKHDPRYTMDARQQKVKANREKRQQMRDTQLLQQQQRKDAQSQAHQIVMKEERSKTLQRQREEALIQQEMARLRKDMQEQRRLAEDAKERERQLESERLESLREEEDRRRTAELETRLKAESVMEEERQWMKQRLEDVRAIKASQDLKSLQRHFHAWYQLVLTKRLTLGKARAVADWRTLLRAWNAWRAYIRASQAERETRELEETFRDTHRKKQLATVHNRQKLLKKYFLAWCLWLRNERHNQELEQQQNKTKSKMAAFLEAAASGKLWTNRSEDEETQENKANSKKMEDCDRPDSVAEKLDDLFGRPAQPRPNPVSTPRSARSDTSNLPDTPQSRHTPHHTAGPSKPKYAWQVMRKHVDLPLDDILAAGDEDNDVNGRHQQHNRNQNNAIENVSTQVSVTSKKNINYKANSFEHRYAAQQRILHEQQYQLREQKRLIEDLQTAQQQQILKMQLGGTAAKDLTAAEMVDGGGTLDSVLESERSQPESCTAPSTARSDHSDSSSTSVNSRKKEPEKAPLLKGMKEREAARLKMKAEREERQRKKEQEKLDEIKAKEKRQREEEEAEKRAKIEKRREEKRLTKQRELDKQQRLEHMNQQTSKAEEHYRRSLLRHKGLDPWVRLLHMAKQNMQVAEDHHSTLLLRKCLLPWRQYTDEVMQEKVAMAEQQYEVIVVRRAFQCWKRYGHLQSIQLQKARLHYAYCLKGKVLKAWQQYITDEKLRMWKNEDMAQDHNQMRIMKVSFLAWRQYPVTLKAQRLRDQRLQDMRKKVASILPDFGDS